MQYDDLHNSFCYTQKSTKDKYTPAGNYMFKVNNRNIRARCEICSKLTIKTPERRHLRLKSWHFSLKSVTYLLLS